MKQPNYWHLDSLLDSASMASTQLLNGDWVPARPLGFNSIGNRWRCAWAVFTGKADAVEWPGQ